MKFLGEVCFKFSCPDHETERRCRGKIEMSVEAYRIARGRGAFVLSVPERVQCGECGRVFGTAKFSSQAENHIVFNPVFAKPKESIVKSISEDKSVKPRRAK